ncbi:MAG: caspase family protein [Alphaproteobacteria bacterium]|nr:caspase family protein [Alphaproteobacteria bacterium]
MSTVSRFYLLVGVAEYVTPKWSLRSPINDVLDTLQTLIRMGLDLSGAEVCTSPKLDVATVAGHYALGAADVATALTHAKKALAGVTFSGGTRHDIQLAADRLKHAMNAAPGAPHLMFTWSGHTMEQGTVMYFCNSDFDQGGSHQRPWVYVGMLGAMGILPFNYQWTPDPNTKVRYDHSVFAIIDGCRAGKVGQLATTDLRRDVVLTATSGELEVRERLLGGAWRGLLTWSVMRVLEQHGLVGGEASDSGLDVSYGRLLQSVRALTMAIQGTRPRPAVPELHGLPGRDPSVLDRRVLQDLAVPAGASSQQGTRVGGDVQLWGDVDHFTVYEVHVTQGKTERLWARVVFYTQDQPGHITYVYQGKEVSLEANLEYWYFDQPLSDELVSRLRLRVKTSTDAKGARRVSGIGDVDAAMARPRVFTAPVHPSWKPQPLGKLAARYLEEGRCGYALRVSPARVDWLKPATGPSPFRNAAVGSDIEFTTELLVVDKAMHHCAAEVG